MSGDVLFSVDPWVGGTRSVGWYGPIECESRVVGKSWEEGIDEIMEEAAAKARALGANAIVGFEIECDPYHRDGGRISFKATAAKLEPLFAGIQVVYP